MEGTTVLIIIASVMGLAGLSLVIGFFITKKEPPFSGGSKPETHKHDMIDDGDIQIEILEEPGENAHGVKMSNGKTHSTNGNCSAMPEWWRPDVVVLKKNGRRKYSAMLITRDKRETKVVRGKKSGLWTISVFRNEQIAALT